ncbi:MAG: GNAT family N-acetyltransferase [Rhodospirillales bacterium]|nr:GNAT family N-acetyltransferase [Rhodospirillales bacterium]
MYLNKPINTPRLTLRSLQKDDAGAPYLSWMQDADVLRFLEPRDGGYDRHSLEQYIADMNNSESNLMLGLVRRDSGAHIGNIKLGGINTEHMDGHIGILIGDKTAWGHGYASEAISAVSNHAADELDLKRVYAGCHANNPGSWKAFINAGFSEEKRQKQSCQVDGKWVDSLTMGRILQ